MNEEKEEEEGKKHGDTKEDCSDYGGYEPDDEADFSLNKKYAKK